MTQIALIELTNYGSDTAVFVNGEYLFSADPANPEIAETVVTVAENLALIHDVELKRIAHPAHAEWQWTEIQEDLRASGELRAGPPPAFTVLKIAFTPESFDYLNEQREKDGEPPLTTAQIRAGCEKAQQRFALNPRGAIERCYEHVLEVCEDFILAEG